MKIIEGYKTSKIVFDSLEEVDTVWEYVKYKPVLDKVRNEVLAYSLESLAGEIETLLEDMGFSEAVVEYDFKGFNKGAMFVCDEFKKKKEIDFVSIKFRYGSKFEELIRLCEEIYDITEGVNISARPVVVKTGAIVPDEIRWEVEVDSSVDPELESDVEWRLDDMEKEVDSIFKTEYESFQEDEWLKEVLVEDEIEIEFDMYEIEAIKNRVNHPT